EALGQQGDRIESVLGDVAKDIKAIGEKVDVVVAVSSDTNTRVQNLEKMIQQMLEKIQTGEAKGEAAASEAEDRQRVQELVADYRELPEEERRKRPELLAEVAKLNVAAGDFEAALR